MSYPIAARPTYYRGCRFRSRLEARWAVFFDHLDIGWLYEPEGFIVGRRHYLPDFLLESGTWVEVKGHEEALDKPFLRRAALTLPQMPASGERGPRLMVLGQLHLPYIEPQPCDIGWLGLEPDGRDGEVLSSTYGFGRFWKNRRPWWIDGNEGCAHWLNPTVHPDEEDTSAAYIAANGARFEHGERGAQ